MHTAGKLDPLTDITPPVTIIIHPVENGLILEAGRQRRVFEVGPGRRAEAVRDVLRAVQAALSDHPCIGLVEARIEVRDGQTNQVSTTETLADMLDTDAVARRLGVSKRTLEGMRAKGTGPAFHEFGGSIRYLLGDVEAWRREHRVTTHGAPVHEAQERGGRA